MCLQGGGMQAMIVSLWIGACQCDTEVIGESEDLKREWEAAAWIDRKRERQRERRRAGWSGRR